MRDIEFRLICELMKNSRRSDRELAKAVGVSQPTVSRLIKKLERQGTIREYTMIPDYRQVGLELAAVTFLSLRETVSQGEIEKLRRRIREQEGEKPYPSILVLNGIGLGSDRVIVSLHESYSKYAEFIRVVKEHPLVRIDEVKSFIVNLVDKNHFQNLTFSGLAKYLLHNEAVQKTKK